jgi:hypothetical protein
MEMIGAGMTLGEAAQRWEMAGRPGPGSFMLRPRHWMKPVHEPHISLLIIVVLHKPL